MQPFTPMRHFALVLLLFCSVSAHAQSITGRVVSIADGDTITVLMDEQQYKIRLYGIDAPEKKQAFGTRAKQYAGELAFGKTVTVIEHGHDRYRRTIGDVILPDGRSMNQEMVRVGLAHWYWKYAPHDTVLEQLEREARAQHLGLWTDPNPTPPWEFRRDVRLAHLPTL